LKAGRSFRLSWHHRCRTIRRLRHDARPSAGYSNEDHRPTIALVLTGCTGDRLGASTKCDEVSTRPSVAAVFGLRPRQTTAAQRRSLISRTVPAPFSFSSSKIASSSIILASRFALSIPRGCKAWRYPHRPLAGMGHRSAMLIPGQAAHLFRDDAAHPFRLIVARHSD
jgi:hypothetical protein